MTKFVNNHKFKAVTVFILSVLLAVARSAILKNNIDIDRENSFTGYFIIKSFSTTALVIITVTIGALFLLLALISKYNKYNLPDPISSPVIFTSALSGFMLFSTGIYFIFVFINGKGSFTIRELILAFLMIFASVPFLYSSLVKSKRFESIYPFLLLTPIAFTAFRLTTDFMKQNHLPVNSSGAVQILSLIFLMMYFISEGKLSTPQTKGYKLHMVYGYLAAFTLLLSAIPNLYLSAFHAMLPLNEYILMSAVDIVLALHIIYNSYNITNHKESNVKDE